MDDTTMTLHDVFMRHKLYKAPAEDAEASLRGEKMTFIHDLLRGAAPACGDLRTDIGLWHSDLQSRGLRHEGDAGMWASMSAASPDIVWLEPLLSVFAYRPDVLRCRYYMAVLGHVGSARYLSRVSERDHDLTGAFAHGMHLHAKKLERIGSSYKWYPGVEIAILVEGCRRLVGIDGGDKTVMPLISWWNQTRRDRSRARDDGERQYLTALVTESQVRSMMRKAVDEGRIADPDEFRTKTADDRFEFGNDTDDDGGVDAEAVADSTEESVPRTHDTFASVAAAVDAKIAALKSPVRPPASAQRGHLVLADIPSKKNAVRHSEGDLEASLSGITGRWMEQVLVSNELPEIASELRAEWPHSVDLINRVLGDLRVGEPVRFRPTLLVGSPGSGKTSLMKAIAGSLLMPSVVFPCASVSDGSFGGTPSQWSTRRASTPLELIRSSDRANPIVILDEIEKSGTSGHNGSLVSALLPMLERGTASAYFEIGIERNADLSAVSFFATANDVTGIPMPLRDRFRILRMPDPEPAHIGSLTRKIISDLIYERGLDERWTPPLAPDEIDIIKKAWGGGSLRRLRRAVEATLAARETAMTNGRAM
ncbi:AAA family ATPase [Aureimonas glaciei]|uniref:AAA+ ATPase domain-containing protein n=1 Tax=Aureimonas glaciei TaxID=1776957 RepID=A0A916Y1R3_9HYPH|nr:AAA family ATPase [Aureimonas glaciei]GGD25920.1 hypothetical protein GCM10011335_31160 [Aureimonas glaciei]